MRHQAVILQIIIQTFRYEAVGPAVCFPFSNFQLHREFHAFVPKKIFKNIYMICLNFKRSKSYKRAITVKVCFI